jgi:Concanavalin A-like lectin/glucanases superfamily
MRFRRDLIIAVLATFCLTSTLFIIAPTKSNPSSESSKYDPWADLNSDGIIDIFDAIDFAGHFGSSGTPLNKSRWYYANWYDALVGFWKFDEGTGNLTADSSGHGNDGALINDPTWIDGKYGKALNFNGTNCVSMGDSESLEVQNFTWEVWIYLMQRPYEQGALEPVILNKSGSDPEWGTFGYTLLFGFPNSTDDHLTVLFGIIGDGPIVPLQYNSINDLTLNQWHQVVVTFESFGAYMSDTTTLYIDGISRLSKTWPYAHHLEYWQSFPLFLGSDGFNGSMDNVMIYNRTLNAEEVMYHYVLPPP